MLKFTDKRGNTIYAYQHPAKLNIHIDFGGASGCTVFLARGTVCLGRSTVHVRGDNATLFVGDSELGNTRLFLDENSCIYIGNKCGFNPWARSQEIRGIGNCVLFIGNDNLFSENLEMSTVDQHVLYDMASLERANENKSIYIGDHVWIGRNCTVLKNSRMASGCMLGIGSLLTGKFAPVNSVNVGVPARPKVMNKLWIRERNFYRPQEIIDSQAVLEQDNPVVERGIFKHDSSVVLRPCDIECTLKSIRTSFEKIAFLYDAFYIKAAHNRFAWSEEEALAKEGKLLSYGDSFTSLLANACLRERRWEALPVFTPDQQKVIDLMGLWQKRYVIYCRYWRLTMMSRICWGKKKKRYKEKRRHCKELVRRIKVLKSLMQKL